MFIESPYGSESIQEKARKYGLIFGETCGNGAARAGFIGKTFQIKDQLKAAGARWNSENKAWVFSDGWTACEAFLDTL